MKKIGFLILIIGLIAFGSAARQSNVEEQVFLHISSNEVITGETLYISAYCLSALTGKPSPLSKILYLELVGEDGVLHKEKISLEGGRGYTEFFVPTPMATAKYQLLAYTRWMKNFGKYFQSSLVVVNPFEKYNPKLDGVEEVGISFYPVGGEVVAGLDNIIGFEIKNTGSQKFKGKVIDTDGEVQVDFTSDTYGRGSFSFQPAMQQDYKTTLEDTLGNIQFFDFPNVVSSGTTLRLEYNSADLLIESSTMPSGIGSGLLIVRSGSGYYSSKEVLLNTKSAYPKNELGEGLVEITLLDTAGNMLCQRLVANNISNTLTRKNVKSKFSCRQKIDLEFNLPAGSYSVSVNRNQSITDNHLIDAKIIRTGLVLTHIPEELAFFMTKSTEVLEDYLLTLPSEVPNKKPPYLMPEFRDEFLNVTIRDKNDKPVANKMIALSVPTSPYQFRTAYSDANGHVSLPFQSLSETASAYISVLGSEDQYHVEVSDQFMEKYPAFDFHLDQFSEEMIHAIVAISITNQLENAFFQSEGTKKPALSHEYQIKFDDSYLLDEYTRFPTLQETFTEFVEFASLRGNRTPPFKTKFTAPAFYKDHSLLLLLDGLPVAQNSLLDFSPYKVKNIDVVNDVYHLGPLAAKGVISLETIEGKRDEFELGETYHKLNILGISPKTASWDINIEGKPFLRRPDMRTQLYWDSELNSNGEKPTEIEFYSSDVEGEYIVSIQGFTSEGRPISIRDYFLVEEVGVRP
ncbi:MAG: hypothetical protein JXQ96_01575 [Cyclobacteriaceae bacterium]